MGVPPITGSAALSKVADRHFGGIRIRALWGNRGWVGQMREPPRHLVLDQHSAA